MRVRNMKQAREQAKANANLDGKPRYIITDTSGNIRVEKQPPAYVEWEEVRPNIDPPIHKDTTA